MELGALLAGEQQRVEEDWRAAKEFHLLVARMSGNPAVHLIAQCLVMLTEEQTTPTRSRPKRSAGGAWWYEAAEHWVAQSGSIQRVGCHIRSAPAPDWVKSDSG